MAAVRTLFRLSLVLGALIGCEPFGPARSALEEGRFPAAALELRQLEPSVRGWPPRARSRYALYRGLAELGLGNAAVADAWLYRAWRADRADPRTFDDREHGALLSAWRSTGRLPGENGRLRAKTAP